MAEGLNRGQFKASEFVTGGHRGATKLRRILATAAPTRNEYEDVVNEIIRLAGLPAPDVNLRRGRYIPDFRWPEHRVILEADSKRFHDQMLARARRSSKRGVSSCSGPPGMRSSRVQTRSSSAFAKRSRAELFDLSPTKFAFGGRSRAPPCPRCAGSRPAP